MTFSEEVEFIWKRRFSPISALIMANRYGAVAYGLLAAYAGLVTDPQVRGQLLALVATLHIELNTIDTV